MLKGKISKQRVRRQGKYHNQTEIWHVGLSSREFNITMNKMLKSLMEKVDSIQ